MGHSSHSNHSNHSNHGNHSNTGHSPISISWSSWDSGIVAGQTSLSDSIIKIKEIRDKIAYIQSNKGPSPLPSVDLSGVSDSTFNVGMPPKATQYNTLKDEFNKLYNKVHGGVSSLPTKYVGDIIYASEATAIKSNIDSLASHDAHSSHGNHTNHSNSDKRLKKNIKEIKYGLKDILRLNPISFDWKNSDEESIGFIAQEMREIIPEIVVEKKDGVLAIEYDKLVAVLVKSIQELNK